MAIAKTKASVKTKAIAKSLRDDVIESQPETETAIEETEVVTQTESVTETESATPELQRNKNVLLQRFTSADIAGHNPALYERLYKTFEPMGVAGNLEAITSLMTDYLEWLSSRKTALEAEAEAKKLEARQKLLALAAKAGITINID
jgi:hypothetical protein